MAMRIKVHETNNAVQFFDKGLSDRRFLTMAKRKLTKLIGFPVSDVFYMDSEGFYPNRAVITIPLKDIWGLSQDLPTFETSITDYDEPRESNPTVDELKEIFNDNLSEDKTASFFADKDYFCEYGFDYNGCLSVDYFTDAIADDPDGAGNAVIVDPDANMKTELRNMADAAKYAIGLIKDYASNVEATL